jgi:hypothetical protein
MVEMFLSECQWCIFFCNEASYPCCYTVHRTTENNVDGTSSLVTEPRAENRQPTTATAKCSVAKRLQWPRKLTNYGLRVTCNNDYFLVMFSTLILLLRQPHLLRNDMHGTSGKVISAVLRTSCTVSLVPSLQEVVRRSGVSWHIS